MPYSTLLSLHARDLRTEAQVETRLLAPLFKHLGYQPKHVIPKERVPKLFASSGSRRAKIETNFILIGSDKSAKVIVEAKDPKRPVQDAWGQAASYALSYNSDKPENDHVQWLLISNGHITSLYRHDSITPTVTLGLADFASGSPPYVTLRSYIKFATADERPAGGIPFRVTPPDELNSIFESCHDLIWKKEKLNPTDAFFEFCKFIFVKVRHDKAREGMPLSTPPHELPMTLAWLAATKSTSSHPVRDILFKDLRDELEAEIARGKKRILSREEEFKLSAATCKELVARFESINLSSIDEDLNGRMFEVFLNAAIRGPALGQYFTPRPLVDFMTRMALHGRSEWSCPPVVIDACCGTAGFLIEAMAYMIAAVKNDTRLSKRDASRLANKIRNECLFGIEANDRVARIARINMYLHGDGGSHIFQGDGLDAMPHVSPDMTSERKHEINDHATTISDGKFDIILTNPPFSMSYSADNADEAHILTQFSLGTNAKNVKSNVLFIERYHNLLKPGGEMLIVIDDTVLNGATHESIRAWILRHFVIVAVHSMPFNAFFKAKANIKTSVVHLRKKAGAEDEQSHVFMSISNNIGHDNSLRDTSSRNNLTDILNVYLEWRRTGVLKAVIRDNHDPRENLECPEQVWLVPPAKLRDDRLDAFAYAPVLEHKRRELRALERAGKIELKTGKDFLHRDKVSAAERRALVDSKKTLAYIEIGDVTSYGLITSYISGTIDTLPSRGQYIVRTGDILVAINNSSRGTVVCVPPEFDGALCTSGFLVLVPRSEEEGLLLWYVLRGEAAREQIYYLAQTASQPELKREVWMNEFMIPMPAGRERSQAIAQARGFQSHISALLNADKVRF